MGEHATPEQSKGARAADGGQAAPRRGGAAGASGHARGAAAGGGRSDGPRAGRARRPGAAVDADKARLALTTASGNNSRGVGKGGRAAALPRRGTLASAARRAFLGMPQGCCRRGTRLGWCPNAERRGPRPRPRPSPPQRIGRGLRCETILDIRTTCRHGVP